MVRNILRTVITVLGAVLGLAVGEFVSPLIENTTFAWMSMVAYVLGALLFGIIFLLLSSSLVNVTLKMVKHIEAKLSPLSLLDITLCAAGLLAGLVIAFLTSTLLNRLPGVVLPFFISTLLYLLFAYLGVSLVYKKRSDITVAVERTDDKPRARPKVLDTSAIIDGRIYDICCTGFIDGELVIPGFVLDELRHISDSPDSQKRRRGRRGLDMLKRLQEENRVLVRVDERDYDGIVEVDIKLLKLATEISGAIVTLDYNLNKVATVQNVPVLNINDLANAIKTTLLPGDELQVGVLQEGKEHGQGLAYLDDGTMIVIDGGKRHIGETVSICVTSVLQTSAGKMVFARLA